MPKLRKQLLNTLLRLVTGIGTIQHIWLPKSMPRLGRQPVGILLWMNMEVGTKLLR